MAVFDVPVKVEGSAEVELSGVVCECGVDLEFDVAVTRRGDVVVSVRTHSCLQDEKP